MWLTVNHNTGITSRESVRCSRCIARASELGSYQSKLCNSRGYEWLQKYKDSLKDCFENLNIAMRKILCKYAIEDKQKSGCVNTQLTWKLIWSSAGECGSSRPGSTRPGHIGLFLYSLLFSIIRMPVSFWLIKNVQQKFEGIMFGRIYIVSLSILTILAY